MKTMTSRPMCFAVSSLLSVCALAEQAAAQTQFEPLQRTQIDLQGGFALAIVVGDIDGDGDRDVLAVDAAGGQTPRGLRIFLNRGDGIFREDLRSGPLLVGPRRLVDVDGDGDLDVFGFGPLSLALLLNDGSGKFADRSANLPNVTFLTGEFPTGVTDADIDGDGDPDIAVGRSTLLAGATDILLLNLGAGFFSDVSFSQLPGTVANTRDLLFSDVDRDGDADLVLANHLQQNRVYRNDGAGNFQDVTSTALPPDLAPNMAVAAGDFDGDGDVDLVFASGYNDIFVGTPGPKNNLLYVNDGTGVFRDATTSSFPRDGFDSVTVDVADVDLDGDLDVAFGNMMTTWSDDEALLLYVNDGRGVFADGSRPRLPRACVGCLRYDGSIQILFGDLDSDGDPDLLQVNHTALTVHANLHRHVYAPSATTTGQTYELRFYSEPGYAAAPGVAHAAVSGGAAAIPAPPFGIIGLDPRSAIPLGSITVPPTEGIARLRFPIPPDPRLVGRQFYFQALMAQGGSVLQWRLTNVWAEQVR